MGPNVFNKLILGEHFSMNRLSDPIEHRKSLAEGLFSLKYVEYTKTNIVKFLDACDARRGTSWRKTLPELVNKLL